MRYLTKDASITNIQIHLLWPIQFNTIYLWISSMNKIVWFLNCASFFAILTISFTSLMPDVVADSFTNFKLFCFLQILEMTFANDVWNNQEDE